jgi:hypothetical protein
LLAPRLDALATASGGRGQLAQWGGGRRHERETGRAAVQPDPAGSVDLDTAAGQQ